MSLLNRFKGKDPDVCSVPVSNHRVVKVKKLAIAQLAANIFNSEIRFSIPLLL